MAAGLLQIFTILAMRVSSTSTESELEEFLEFSETTILKKVISSSHLTITAQQEASTGSVAWKCFVFCN